MTKANTTHKQPTATPSSTQRKQLFALVTTTIVLCLLLIATHFVYRYVANNYASQFIDTLEQPK